ncbi:hypothetical protein ACHAPU_000109 [Fusarium lateritium]
MSLFSGQSSPLVTRSDVASFGFESRFSLSVDCKAGANGVLTLSLPETTIPSVGQTVSGDGSTGYGNSDSDAETNPPAGEPGSNNNPSSGGTTGSNNGQIGTFPEGGGKGNSDGNNGADSLNPGADCEGGSSEGGPLQSGNNNGQTESQPGPFPAKPSESDNPPQDGQPTEPPANPAGVAPPQPGASDGNNVSSGPEQGPEKPQLAPATAPAQNPAPPTPEDNEVPDQNPADGPEDDSTPQGPDAASSVDIPTGILPADSGDSVDCLVYVNEPACTSQGQTTHNPPVPTSAPAPAPASSVPQGPLTVPSPVPNLGNTSCEDTDAYGDGVPDCPDSNQPPVANPDSDGNSPTANSGGSPNQESGDGGYGDDGLCSDPSAGDDCNSSAPPPPGSAPPIPPPSPQLAPPVVPGDCPSGSDSSCQGLSYNGPGSGSSNPPALPPSTPQPPPSPVETNSPTGNGVPCGGTLGPCPGEITDQGNASSAPNQGASLRDDAPPSPSSRPPASPSSSSPEGQASGSPGDVPGNAQTSAEPYQSDDHDVPGSGRPEEGDKSDGQGDIGPQSLGAELASVQPAPSGPVASALPQSPAAKPSSPQPTDSAIVGGPHGGPHLVTVIVPTQIESTKTKVITV